MWPWLFITDNIAVHCDYLGGIVYILWGAPSVLRPNDSRMYILFILGNILFVLCKSSRIDEGKLGAVEIPYFHHNKYSSLQTKPNQSLVAECYEPFIFRMKPTECTYQIFLDDAPYETSFKNKFRRKVNK